MLVLLVGVIFYFTHDDLEKVFSNTKLFSRLKQEDKPLVVEDEFNTDVLEVATDKASDWQNELDKGIAARKLGGNKLPFVTATPAQWYLPWEDRQVETPAGLLVAPAFRRSVVVRFPTDAAGRNCKAGW